MSGASRPGVTTGADQFLQSHPVIAHALPHPDETWHRAEVPDYVADSLSKLQYNHVVEIAERHGAPTEYDAHLFRTKRAPYQFVQANVDRARTLDCGHQGIRNLGDGEYTCQRDACDIRVGPAEAREVLRG